MSKEYKILDVQQDGLFFPNDDEVAYSDMKRVYKNNIKQNGVIIEKTWSVEDDIYGGDKLIIKGNNHLLYLYVDGGIHCSLPKSQSI
jgi:hypothetical protein